MNCRNMFYALDNTIVTNAGTLTAASASNKCDDDGNYVSSYYITLTHNNINTRVKFIG